MLVLGRQQLFLLPKVFCVLHQSSEPPKCDKVFMDIRKGLATLEYIVLRELDFNIVQKRPLNVSFFDI